MEINQIIKKISNEKNGFYLIESTSLNFELLENEIKNIFFDKQYEIDTSFISLVPDENAKFISVDQIRKLKKEFLHTNVLNLSKVILINEINALNTNSINALLKLIEEVPHKTFFIFCTSNLLKIPETILSRARVIRLNNYQHQGNLDSLTSDILNQNPNVSDDLIKNLINPFIDLKKSNFLDNVKLFSRDQHDVCSIVFLKILNHYLRLNLHNRKLFKYLYELHSGFIYDLDESIKFNTMTNDLIAIYFSRLNSNLIKYAK